MDRNPPSLLGAALDLVINRAHDWTPDGKYKPLSDQDRRARLASLPGHPSKVECATALERAHALLECAEFLGVRFHRRDPIGGLFLGDDPRGPETFRSEYPGTAEGFADDELRRAFWEGVMRMRK